MLADNDGTDISNSSQMSAKFPGHSSSRRILPLEELFLPEYGSAGPDGPGYSQEDGSPAWLIKEKTQFWHFISDNRQHQVLMGCAIVMKSLFVLLTSVFA